MKRDLITYKASNNYENSNMSNYGEYFVDELVPMVNEAAKSERGWTMDIEGTLYWVSVFVDVLTSYSTTSLIYVEFTKEDSYEKVDKEESERLYKIPAVRAEVEKHIDAMIDTINSSNIKYITSNANLSYNNGKILAPIIDLKSGMDSTPYLPEFSYKVLSITDYHKIGE